MSRIASASIFALTFCAVFVAQRAFMRDVFGITNHGFDYGDLFIAMVASYIAGTRWARQ